MSQIPYKVEQGIVPTDQGGRTLYQGQGLEVSEAEQAFLFGPIKWVGHADQTLECEFGRLGPVENCRLRLR